MPCLQGLPAKSRLQTKVLTSTCTKHPNVDMSLQVEPATPTRRMWLPRPKGSAVRSGCAPSLALPLSNFSCLALPRSEQSKGPCVTNHTLQSHLWKELGGLKLTCAIFNDRVTCALNWPLFKLFLSARLPILPRIPLAIGNFQVSVLPSASHWPWPFVSCQCQHLEAKPSSIHRHQEPCGCSTGHSSRTHCCPGSWLWRQWKTACNTAIPHDAAYSPIKNEKMQTVQVLLATMTTCSQVRSPVQHLEPCFLAQVLNVLLKQLVSIYLFHHWLLFVIHPTSRN